MGLTSFNRMRRAQAAARLAEQERLAAEEFAVQEAERLAREEEERLREEEEGLKAAEEAARLEAERLAGEQGQREEGSEPIVETATEQPDDSGGEVSFNKLRARAKELRIEGYGKMTKDQLVEAIAQTPVEE